jgi:hypothetical protein
MLMPEYLRAVTLSGTFGIQIAMNKFLRFWMQLFVYAIGYL